MTNTTTLENVVNEVHQSSINHFDEVMPVHPMATIETFSRRFKK